MIDNIRAKGGALIFCGVVADDQLVHGLPNKQTIEIELMSVVGKLPLMLSKTCTWEHIYGTSRINCGGGGGRFPLISRKRTRKKVEIMEKTKFVRK
jgi:hypothetical protein